MIVKNNPLDCSVIICLIKQILSESASSYCRGSTTQLDNISTCDSYQLVFTNTNHNIDGVKVRAETGIPSFKWTGNGWELNQYFV